MTEELAKICGAIEVPNREEDDPHHFVILHRDVGGEQCRRLHLMHNPKCWCNPLVVAPEDSRRQIYRDQFAALKVLN